MQKQKDGDLFPHPLGLDLVGRDTDVVLRRITCVFKFLSECLNVCRTLVDYEPNDESLICIPYICLFWNIIFTVRTDNCDNWEV